MGHFVRRKKLGHLSLTSLIPRKRAREDDEKHILIQHFSKGPSSIIRDGYRWKTRKQLISETSNV